MFVVVVDNNEPFVSTTERNSIGVIVPPIGDTLVVDNSTKLSHTIDLTPPVLTNPFLIARVVDIRLDINNITLTI